MSMTGRATAVFPTAPALGMVSVLVLLVSSMPRVGISSRARLAGAASALVAGLLCNSKSFLLGVPVAIALGALSAGSLGSYVLLAASGLATAVALAMGGGQDSLVQDPLGIATGAATSLTRLTGGRLNAEGWGIYEAFRKVIDDSPVLGYGIGIRPDLFYSDSGLNRLVLHAGLLGLLVVVVGIAMQMAWFWQRRGVHAWARLGLATLTASLTLFMAAAVFVMPRVNDVLFTLLGTAIAVTRHQEARDAAANDSSQG